MLPLLFPHQQRRHDERDSETAHVSPLVEHSSVPKSTEEQVNLRFNQTENNSHIPRDQRLAVVPLGVFSVAVKASVIAIDNMAVVATSPGLQHQPGAGDPEQEDDDFADEADDGDESAAACERVAAVVGEDGVDSDGEGEDGRYDYLQKPKYISWLQWE